MDEIYGLKRVYHAGGLVGYATRVTRIPERDLTVIVLSNGTFQEYLPGLVRRVLYFYLRS